MARNPPRRDRGFLFGEVTAARNTSPAPRSWFRAAVDLLFSCFVQVVVLRR